MTLPWWRFYPEMLKDPKIERVCRSTELPRMLIIGTWATLLSLASNSPTRGVLLLTDSVALTLDDLCFETSLDDQTLNTIMQEFAKLSMLEYDAAEGAWRILNWERYEAPKRSTAWQQKRADILLRDIFTCQYCGKPAVHVDHIMPRCQGGGDEPTNLVAACAHCNLSKGGRTPEQAGMTLSPMESP